MNKMQEFQKKLETAILNPGTPIDVPLEVLDEFSAVQVRGDGRCLWHSIAASALLVDYGMSISELRNLDAEGKVRPASRKLRLDICTELWDDRVGSFKARYRDFWAPGEEGTEGAQTPSMYIELLRQGRIFGGEFELYAAASLLQRDIAIVNVPCAPSSRSAYIVNIKPDVSSQTKPLLLIRSGLHFNVLHHNIATTKTTRI